MKHRTLIVDDEPLARERLSRWLEAEPDLEVIGECADGRQAVERILTDRPALVFLDVQMPELDGFGVLEALHGEPLPVIVFATAYDQFAVKAFEVHAVDYLLKPFDRERLRVALDRARQRLARPASPAMPEELAALLADLRPREGYPARIAVRSEGRVALVRADDIDWVEASDNYVILHVGAENHILRDTLTAFEARLNPERFLRISRSTIVNMDRIKELQPLFHGEYAVILRNGTRLTLSRGYRDKLKVLGLG